MFDPPFAKLLDPTFGRIARDAASGTVLDAADISLRLHAGHLSTVRFQDLTSYGDLAAGYAIPYPLVWFACYVGDPHQRPKPPAGPNPAAFLRPVSLPLDGTLWETRTVILFRRATPAAFTCNLDSKAVSVTCGLAGGLSNVRACSRLSGVPGDVEVLTMTTESQT